jgi:fibronectin type 3 domain-containing protein
VSEEWSSIVSTEDTTFLDTGLEADTTYYYRVLTVTVDGNTGPSDVISATTPTVPPAAPNLSSSASGFSITLSWTDVDGETGFRIERTVSGMEEWVILGTTGEDVLTYEDGGLAAGSSYDYRVFATGEGGDSPPSNVVTVTVVGDSASTSEDEGAVPPPPGGH